MLKLRSIILLMLKSKSKKIKDKIVPVNFSKRGYLAILTLLLFFISVLTKGPCERTPCQNGAQCTDISLTDYTCQCPFGFDGRNCENRIRSKASFFCLELVLCTLIHSKLHTFPTVTLT